MIGSKPVVCVTGSTNNAVFPEATREIQMTMAYCDAIYSAGGVPVVGPEHGAEELSELCDALLLTGGRDVEPGLYGEEVLNDTVRACPYTRIYGAQKAHNVHLSRRTDAQRSPRRHALSGFGGAVRLCA